MRDECLVERDVSNVWLARETPFCSRGQPRAGRQCQEPRRCALEAEVESAVVGRTEVGCRPCRESCGGGVAVDRRKARRRCIPLQTKRVEQDVKLRAIWKIF